MHSSDIAATVRLLQPSTISCFKVFPSPNFTWFRFRYHSTGYSVVRPTQHPLKLWFFPVGCDISQTRGPIPNQLYATTCDLQIHLERQLAITAARISVSFKLLLRLHRSSIDFVSTASPLKTSFLRFLPTHHLALILLAAIQGSKALVSPYSLELILLYNITTGLQCNTNDK